MRAVVITGVGGPEVLEVREVPTPEPQAGEILVRVRATALNRADLMQAKGQYPPPPGAPADIPGLEYAGEVVGLGPNCLGPQKLGDRVFGIVAGGGLAEYVVTPERLAMTVPASLDDVSAAAVPEVFLTAFDALENRGRAEPGERILIHAIGGGVGSAASQIAHAMGCYVFGTSRTPDKLERAESFGLDRGIDTSADDFVEVIAREANGEGVDVVVDHLGGSAFESNLAVLANKGRLVIVGLLGGASASVDLSILMRKRLTIVGTTLRARPVDEKIALTQTFTARILPWFDRGLVRPVLDAAYPFADVREALERVRSSRGFGKVVLTI